MSLKIYTYSNPYEIDKEPYAEEIKNLPEFCVSQTMVNGLRSIYYNKIKKGQLATVDQLINNMFEDWQSTAKSIRQFADLDNVERYGDFLEEFDEEKGHITEVLLKNAQSIYESIRILVELGVEYNEIDINKLSEEQRILVMLYNEVTSGRYSNDFQIKASFEKLEVINIIKKTLIGDVDEQNGLLGRDISGLNFDTIIIHGVHQFTPIILRAIEELSKYVNIIMLFNYQRQYSKVYQTWINVYSAFNSQIITYPHNEFRPLSTNKFSYESNLLGDQMGSLVEGKKGSYSLTNNIELVEFNNITEFANYVARCFKEASVKQADSSSSNERADGNPLHYMKELFYSADMRVNDILKVYFPEQFGERKFLNYPIGHFFVAITNMWDVKNGGIKVDDLDDVRECLSSGIVREDNRGELASIFEQAVPLFTNCHSIRAMIKALEKVQKNKRVIYDEEEKKQIYRLSYYNLTDDKCQKLLTGLKELDEIAKMFYEDFENQDHNFKSFYTKMQNFLQDKISEDELDDEFRGIIKRVLVRLDEVRDIDARASFDCLKSTMSIYLQQENDPAKSAHWIVKGFNQIDGDILQSNSKWESGNKERIYHFACISDENMPGDNGAFPWPLDEDFFERAQDPIDWKFQVYMNARREAKNFNRYALIYGLEFNRASYKISYIKNDQNENNHPYYLLRMLGVNVQQYSDSNDGYFASKRENVILHKKVDTNYSPYDLYRFRVCKYKFLLESIIEGDTVYKDDFMMLRYFEVVLENRVRIAIQGKARMDSVIDPQLEETYNELRRCFPFALKMNKIDIISKVKKHIMSINKNNYKGEFWRIKDNDREYMKICEIFIKQHLNDEKNSNEDIFKGKFESADGEEVKNELSTEALEDERYDKNVAAWCNYCANRDVCLVKYEKF